VHEQEFLFELHIPLRKQEGTAFALASQEFQMNIVGTEKLVAKAG